MSAIRERDAAKTLDWLDSFSIPVEGRAAIAKAEGVTIASQVEEV